LLMVRGREAGVRLVDFTDLAKPGEREIAASTRAADFLADGARIAIGETGVLRIVSLEGKGAAAQVETSTERIVAVSGSPRGRYIALVDQKMVLQVWEMAEPSPRRRVHERLEPIADTCAGADVAFAPDESAVAAISCFNNVHVRTLAGRATAVPRARESYESCCGVKIRFSPDGRYLIARRGFQPGWDAFLWTFRGGVFAGGRKLPGADYVRDFAFLKGTRELLVLDKGGLRRIDPAAPNRATTLVAMTPEENDGLAVSADGTRLATIEGENNIVLRALSGAVLGRITLQ
jgi:WD40 repeat protein